MRVLTLVLGLAACAAVAVAQEAAADDLYDYYYDDLPAEGAPAEAAADKAAPKTGEVAPAAEEAPLEEDLTTTPAPKTTTAVPKSRRRLVNLARNARSRNRTQTTRRPRPPPSTTTPAPDAAGSGPRRAGSRRTSGRAVAAAEVAEEPSGNRFRPSRRGSSRSSAAAASTTPEPEGTTHRFSRGRAASRRGGASKTRDEETTEAPEEASASGSRPRFGRRPV